LHWSSGGQQTAGRQPGWLDPDCRSAVLLLDHHVHEQKKEEEKNL